MRIRLRQNANPELFRRLPPASEGLKAARSSGSGAAGEPGSRVAEGVGLGGWRGVRRWAMALGGAGLALAVAVAGLGRLPSAQAVYGGLPYSGPSGNLPFVQILKGGALACGGTLILPGWVLTAEHCFDQTPTGYELRVGSATLGQGVETSVAELHGSPTLGVTLVKLATPVQGITPVRLANEYPTGGDRGTVFGWGRTTLDNSGPVSQQLKEATVVVRQAEGNEILTGRVTGWSRYGDSGGPFSMMRQGEPAPRGDGLQYGVVNAADNEGTENEVGVLVPVARVLPFIRATTGDNSLGG